jgi:ASC-1-like (ASCH) protein
MVNQTFIRFPDTEIVKHETFEDYLEFIGFYEVATDDEYWDAFMEMERKVYDEAFRNVYGKEGDNEG